MSEENQSYYKTGKPTIPYLRVHDKLLDYDYTNRIFELLEHNAPELLNRFGSLIVEYAKRIQKKEERLEKLEEERTILAGEVAENRRKLKISLEEIPVEPKTYWHENILSIGLSILLFIGVLKFLDVELENMLEQQYLPRSILAIAASICINLAEKKSIENYVYHYVEKKNNSKIEANNFKNYLLESPILVTTLIIISETGLASAGLQSINMGDADDWLSRMAIFMGSALAALVNVNLAWSVGIKRAKWKIEFQGEKKDRIRENTKYIVKYESDKELLKNINKQILRIKKEIKIEKEEAVKEFSRWERDVKMYLKVSQFSSRKSTDD
ncbi:MAG: hypothetical protein QNJ51_13840 [Calothrix sp. MO_167.B12]|nr:hypothetical protein [Calothrix sp. MO_167.B12]